MGGYCDMGRLYMARPPASMMMMAMTHAKTGRSKKNLDNIRLLRHFDAGEGWFVFAGSPLSLRYRKGQPLPHPPAALSADLRRSVGHRAPDLRKRAIGRRWCGRESASAAEPCPHCPRSGRWDFPWDRGSPLAAGPGWPVQQSLPAQRPGHTFPEGG